MDEPALWMKRLTKEVLSEVVRVLAMGRTGGEALASENEQ
jgi:hypothetical protein